jgi:Transglycosylase SLT domain
MLEMKGTRIIVAVLAAAPWLGIGLFTATPTQAQIATTVDEHGKTVYVNQDSQPNRHGSTISSLPALSAASKQETLAAPPEQLERIAREAAERHQVDPALVKAVIATESGWNPHAVSNKGAMGLMQLVPGTAERFGVGNPYDPVQNIDGGTRYLKSLLDRYNGDVTKSIAAYNAGEHAVDAINGVPRIPETQRYVRKVTDAYFRPGSKQDAPIWIPRKDPVRREVRSDGRVVFTNE